MKTVFEDNLDSFLYGATCEADSGISFKEAYGIIINKPENANYNLKNIQAAAVAVAAGTLLSVSAITSGTILKINERHKSEIRAHASGVMRIDERGRQELIARLNSAREYCHLSQEDVADLLCINKSTISKLERGEHYPDSKNLEKYNSFLALTDYLKIKLNGRKYAIRQFFSLKLKVFDDMNAVEFAKDMGEDGLNEVISIFKRQYG